MPYLSPTVNRLVSSFFAATGTTREETALRAFPAGRVPERLTTVEQLVERERLNQRDRSGHSIAIVKVCHEASGSRGHKQHAVRFLLADGTEQYFPPHTN